MYDFIGTIFLFVKGQVKQHFSFQKTSRWYKPLAVTK